ncbi:MAG: NfeD family protein [Armatimonadota bacterium]
MAAAFLLASLGGVCWAQSGAPSSADPSTWGRIAAFVDTPWMTVILLVAGCALLFHDLLTPLTWGVTGTAGVLLIGLVFASHVTGHTGGWIGVLLLLVGLALLLLEIHVIPGFGMTGISGLLLLFLGMFWSLGGPRNVAFALPVSSVLAVVTLLAFFAYLPKSAVWQQLGEQMRQRANHEQIPAGEAEFSPIGQHGIVLSPLCPYGMADIAGIKREVVTEGDFLAEGTPIVVSSVEGSRVIVESAVAQVTAA